MGSGFPVERFKNLYNRHFGRSIWTNIHVYCEILTRAGYNVCCIDFSVGHVTVYDVDAHSVYSFGHVQYV